MRFARDESAQGIAITIAAVIVVALIVVNASYHYWATRPGPRVMYLQTLSPTSTGVHASIDRYTVDGRPVTRGKTGLDVPPGSTLTIDGWAFDDVAREPLAAVLVAIDERQPYVAPYGLGRPDVAAVFGCPACTDSGFKAVLLPSDLPPGVHRVRLRYVLRDEGAYEEAPPLIVRVAGKAAGPSARGRAGGRG